MARYVKVIPSIDLVDPTTDLPTGQSVPWQDAVRAIFADNRLTQALDVFSLFDVRQRLIGAGAEYVRLSETEWAALLPFYKNPGALSVSFVYSGQAFFRSFVEAPTNAPE